MSDTFLSKRNLLRVLESFTCGCNHLSGVIIKFHGFEDLLMAIEDVDLLNATANREIEVDSSCILIVFELGIYSMFKFFS